MAGNEYRGKYHLVNDLGKLLETMSDADVNISTGEEQKQFKAHSVILAARSSTIKEEIQRHKENEQEQQSNSCLQLLFKDITPATFERVLKYMYTGRIRLGSSYVFDVLFAANLLDLAGLRKTCISYVYRSVNGRHILSYLERAVTMKEPSIQLRLRQIMTRIVQDISKDVSFFSAPQSTIESILRQDMLNATEAQIWNFVVEWARYQEHSGAKVAEKVSINESMEVKKMLKQFARPGLLRLINIDVETVASKVEALEIFPRSEILKKYRFEAFGQSKNFSLAFPYPEVDFFRRVRNCGEYRESDHPHGKGVDEIRVITMPSWVSSIQITFDAQCELGRYADLTFHTDESLSRTSVSLRSLLGERIKAIRRRDGSETMKAAISCRRLWCRFYSPHNFEPGWGYRLQVEGK